MQIPRYVAAMTDPAITAAYISGSFTLFAAVVAFGPVAFQLWRQGALNRAASIDAEKAKFKSELYADGVRAARAVSNAASEYHGYLRAAQFQVEIASLASKEGYPPQLPTSRFPDLISFQRTCSDKILELVFLIEERRVLNPKLIIFRDALNVASYELQQAFDQEAQLSLMKAFPTQLPDGQIYPYSPPSDDELRQLGIVVEKMTDALSDFTSYAEDFIVELQNLLLSDVFGHVVEHRQPLDPSRRVIRLADYEELRRWIATTPWGLECSRIEQQTLNQIA